jgi:hypothetical protein
VHTKTQINKQIISLPDETTTVAQTADKATATAKTAAFSDDIINTLRLSDEELSDKENVKF